MKKYFLIFIFCVAPFIEIHAAPAIGAKETIEQFYRASFLQHEPKHFRPPFSRGFLADEKKNRTFCAATSPDSICAWDADIAPYLNCQECGDFKTLTYENTKVRISQKGFVVLANLTPAPDIPDAPSKIAYFMIEEDNHWVVDDIYYLEGEAQYVSVRQAINENKMLPAFTSSYGKSCPMK